MKATILTALLCALAGPALAEEVIVTAAGARVRTQPVAGAATVAQLKLGDVLTKTADSGSGAERWVGVARPDIKPGWVSGALVQPFDSVRPLPAQTAIADRKLAQKDAPFGDLVELTGFMDAAAAGAADPAAKGELQLRALLALGRSLAAMQGDNDAPAHAGWIKAQAARIVYSEPAGEWYVQADQLWTLDAAHRGTALGERAAWAAANTDLPGECEGYLPCYLGYLSQQEGEYLRRYPAGAHAAEALATVTQELAEAVKGEDINRDFGDYDEDLYAVCTDLQQQLAKVANSARARTALQALIAKVPPAKRRRS